MTLNISMPGQEELKPRITVFGVGGAGGNAVNNMIEKNLQGVEFVVANTDAQALQNNKAETKIQLGVKVTEGLGAGAKASVGSAAAEESIEQIVDHLAGAHMCFITAGMGGGTGTGAAPIIAQAARELGVLTVGVVTKPFQFEGAKRMRQAEEGVENLQKVVDTLIIIPNQNLFRMANEKTTFTEAFAMADDVLYQGVKGVTDLMVCPGLINLDFADVRSVMDEMGKAMMGTGESDGEDRAIQAAEKAIANPLLDEISLRGAKGVLINITGSHDLTLFELDEAANRIREEVDPEANIIVGSTLDPDMQGIMRVSVVATGIDVAAATPAIQAPQAAQVEQPAAQPTPAPVAETPAATQQTHFEPQLHAAPPPFEPQARHPEPTPTAAPQASEEVPAPVYQPQPEAQAPATPAYEEARTAAPVTPSRPAHQKPMDMRSHIPHPGFAPEERVERPRGIGRLIDTMRGRSNDLPQQAAPQAPAPAQSVTPVAPPPQNDPVPEPIYAGEAPVSAPAATVEEEDKIEIPAFLRRQAN